MSETYPARAREAGNGRARVSGALKGPGEAVDRDPRPDIPAPPPMADLIPELVKRIQETRPVQSARRQSILEELKQIRHAFDAEAAPDQAHNLDAALLLMEFMSRSEKVATAETLSIVATLVSAVSPQHVRELSRVGATNGPSAPGHPGGEVDTHSDLRLSQEFLLGSLLVQSNVISPDSLSRALHLHTSTGLPLGKCLIKLGAATPEQIDHALEFQDRVRDDDKASHHEPRHLEMRISPQQRGFVMSFHAQVLGEVMIRLGMISREQLEKALRVQRAADLHLGAALVESGAATWAQVRRALEVQKQLRHPAA